VGIFGPSPQQVQSQQQGINTQNLQLAQNNNNAAMKQAISQLQSWLSANPAPAQSWGNIIGPGQGGAPSTGGGSFGGPNGGSLGALVGPKK
jgi:hypothetical protein